MKRAWSSPVSTSALRGGTTRRSWLVIGSIAAVAVAVGGCGGGDDDSAESTTTTTLELAPAEPTTPPTSPPTTPSTTDAVPEEVVYVTEGATVVVANASSINGAAGRMSEQLEIAGYSMGEATNSSEGQLETTKIYYDAANADAQAVADSLRLALGNGDIQLFEMGVPAPVESGEIGDASIVVAMGNDTADKTLGELQGGTASTTDADESGDDESGDDGTGDDESTDDESTDDGSGDDESTDG